MIMRDSESSISAPLQTGFTPKAHKLARLRQAVVVEDFRVSAEKTEENINANASIP
jgi:hypothetical protein